MKKIVKTIALLSLLIPAVTIGAKAQSADSVKHEHHFGAFKKILTEDQKAMLKANRQKQKAAHEAFKATLTADQKAILHDKSLDRKDKKAKLEATLTPDQKQMMANNKATRQADRKAFMATLSDAQKAQLKEVFKGRHGGKGGFRHHHDGLQKS